MGKYDKFKYDDYVESEAVKKAKAALDSLLSQAPKAYTSQWNGKLTDALNAVLNRGKFSYDLNSDALYQQYKDRYLKQGKLAMQNTVGQAAALTGGYGNSYAVTAGNQAYQGYLEGLNDMIPQLYSLAAERYDRESQELIDRYSLLADRENTDYGRYRDTLADYYTDRDYLAGQYNSERDYDYTRYSTDRDFSFGVWSDQRNFDYQQERDSVADAQWQAQMSFQEQQAALAYQQWLAEMEYKEKVYQSDNDAQKEQFEYEKSIDQRDFEYEKSLDERNYEYQKGLDDRDYQLELEELARRQAQDELDAEHWEKEYRLDVAELTGSNGGVRDNYSSIPSPGMIDKVDQYIADGKPDEAMKYYKEITSGEHNVPVDEDAMLELYKKIRRAQKESYVVHDTAYYTE